MKKMLKKLFYQLVLFPVLVALGIKDRGGNKDDKKK